MVEPLRHRQTKGAATDMFYLTPPRHISTLPKADFDAALSHVRFTPDNALQRRRPPRPLRAGCGLTHRNKERPLREGWLETLATRAAISVTAREPAVYPRRNSLLSRRRAHLRRSAGTPHSPSARPVQSRAGFLFSFSSHCRLIGWQPAYD